jgi:non-heme chloroperoxidase
VASVTGTSDNVVHYEDTGGSGRPLVLIHGWPLSGKSWADNLPALTAAGYRVITYDRRGFGESDKPTLGYGYDNLADDLAALLDQLDLRDVTLVGFSMGGGEVARYIARHGQERLHSVVFAAAVTPYMMHGSNNPDGPLTKTEAAKMTAQLTANRDAFFDGFVTQFFSAGDRLCVSEQQRQQAIALCQQASKLAALEAMQSFGLTDFREDLEKVTVPALVIHGDSDGIVPFEGSGERTHKELVGSELVLIAGGPHGINVSHAGEFNQALITFLGR